MKHFIFILSFLLVITGISYAQNSVQDRYPASVIYAIDYSTGQETLANVDAGILFKDAFIDLVNNTSIARVQMSMPLPGRKSYIITQMDPQTNGNAYQLVLQRTIFKQNYVIFTFVYNVDQNTLSYFNTQAQGYIGVPIQGFNLNNLNNCFTYGKFNMQVAQPAPEQAAQPTADQGQQPAVDAVADSITAPTPPPALQDEVQPDCPTEGWLWQPGNWAYNGSAYVWVPGVWAAPTEVGFLWTPGYWGYENGVYLMHAGYWGATIGFYGGLNFGYGYAGEGFVGARWEGGHFRYNTAIMRGRFHYGYEDRSVVFHGVRNRAAFNGRGGIERGPSVHERAEFDRRNNEVIRARAANRANYRATARPGGVGTGRPAGVGAVKPGVAGAVKPGIAGAVKPGAAPTKSGGLFSKISKAASKTKLPKKKS